MDKIQNGSQTIKRLLIIMPFFIVVLFLTNLFYIDYFNKQEHNFASADEAFNVSMTIGGREDSTSSWVKRRFNCYGRIVDLNAQTIDVVLTNDSIYEIRNWKMRIDFKQDCFINNAWCGTVEIHQNVLTDEKVQTIDLRNYNLDEIELDYLYDGDLLIRLSQGDYIVYKPSAKDNELPVFKQSQLTMGLILYYLDYPDLSMRQITYRFNRKMTDSSEIFLIGILFIIWLLLLIIYGVYYFTYRATVKEIEIKKSGIASMSDMYAIIYIIDIIKNELMPVVADEESEKLRPKNMTASDQLINMFKYDCEEAYQDIAFEFCDLETLADRLKDRSTVAFEYKSIQYGWCRIRFFAMDKEKNLPLEKVVFTIQVINDEKEEMESIARKVDVAEHESKAKSTFLANMSHEIRTPINTVIGFDTMIMRESKDPVIKSYAKTINSAANMLLSIINGILDISKLEADKMELDPNEYSVKEMLSEVVTMIKGRNEFEKLEFICNISPDIPAVLYGDSVRIKQVILNLLTNAAKYTDQGSVTLTIFGKKHDDMEHLLISVKDTGIGIREEDQKKLAERFERFDRQRNNAIEGSGLGLNLVTGLLALMDSKLNVISTYGEGSEFYFEIEQKIVSDEKIGATEFGAEFEDDSYRALFTAPEGKVLVVDDNEMNLSVFTNLLKETELQIDTAASGLEALDKCDEKKYDLIFMDHMMPQMDGVECFREIRSREASLNHDTKIIILTANALKGAKEEYDEIGFNDFLAKPIVADQLERMIIKHINPGLLRGTVESKAKEDESVEIPVLSGVDTAYGIAHTGDLKNYLALLKQVNTVGTSDLQELKASLGKITENNKDFEAIHAFRIKIHSMKATANIMGAMKIYGLAATIEDEASKENAQAILTLSPFFVEAWEKLSQEIRECFMEKTADGSGVAENLEEYLHLLETSIKAYDIKNADSVMAKIHSFAWNEEKKELINKLETAVANLNAEEVLAICAKLRD